MLQNEMGVHLSEEITLNLFGNISPLSTHLWHKVQWMQPDAIRPSRARIQLMKQLKKVALAPHHNADAVEAMLLIRFSGVRLRKYGNTYCMFSPSLVALDFKLAHFSSYTKHPTLATSY